MRTSRPHQAHAPPTSTSAKTASRPAIAGFTCASAWSAATSAAATPRKTSMPRATSSRSSTHSCAPSSPENTGSGATSTRACPAKSVTMHSSRSTSRPIVRFFAASAGYNNLHAATHSPSRHCPYPRSRGCGGSGRLNLRLTSSKSQVLEFQRLLPGMRPTDP